MCQGIKSIFLLLLFLSVIGKNACCQVTGENIDTPEFSNTGKMIENMIRLNISERDYESLGLTTGEKMDINARKVIINDDTLKLKKVGTRGQSTLMLKRKSLSFKLKSKATFRHGESKESLKKFSLLSLSMDKYYCHNRLAFEMMDTVGIFNLFYAFSDLEINDRSEGIFMIVERPEDWALKGKGSHLVIRRGYEHRIEKFKADKKTDRKKTREYISDYKQIYRVLHEFDGEELYTAILEYLDIDNYMKWLAFNFLVHNGDYADEVFFYMDPDLKKYRIIPWDYDDIFATTPHEGVKQRNRIIGDNLIFSSEDLLDIKIATDPYLYGVYLERLKDVLETLSPEVLRHIIEKTYAELFPYYSDEEIISNVQFDIYKNASIENLKVYLSQIYLLLYNSRNSYLQYIDNIKN
jgi:spore coat protein H